MLPTPSPAHAHDFMLETPSPLGTILLCSDGEALTGLYFTDQRDCPAQRPTTPPPVPAVLHQTAGELAEYFAGTRRQFTVPLRPPGGTPFARRVWQGLADIPYGTLHTYASLAEHIGLTRQHCRALGTANGANPISILIPCHRVIAAGQKLGGYGGGLPRKRALLALEGHGWAKNA